MTTKVTKNMSEGKPLNVLIKFAIPVILSVLLQQFYNIIDSVFAGKLISNETLAAVNASFPVIVIFISLANGFGSGSGVILSRIFGSGNFTKLKSCISTILIFTCFLAIILTTIGALTSNILLKLLSTPTEILNDCNDYFLIYIYGLIFLFLYNAVGYIFTAIGNSKIPLFLLIFSTILNIILDIIFVSNLKLGIKGLAWATFISQAVSAIASTLILLLYIKKMPKTNYKFKVFSPKLLLNAMEIGLPSAIQFAAIAIGQIIIQSVVNPFGANTVAAYGAASKINMIIMSTIIAISASLSTYVAQNIGAMKIERLKPGLKISLSFVICFAIIATIITLPLAETLIRIFTSSDTTSTEAINSTKEILKIGRNYILIVTPWTIVIACKILLDGFIRGANDVIGYTSATIIDLIVRVCLAFLFVAIIPKDNKIFGGSNSIWWAWPISWIVGLITTLLFFISKRWEKTSKIDEIEKAINTKIETSL